MSAGIGAIGGAAALGIAQLISWWIWFRPRKLSMRDYYDAYYNHCRGCEHAE